MKRDGKKALYESIMNSVAREVKKTLNESVEYEKMLNEKLDNWTEEDFKSVGDKVGTILARNDLDLTSVVIDILKWGNTDQIKLFTQAMRKANTKYAIQMSKLDY